MSQPLRIAHIISVMDYGGVEAMALLLLKQLPTSEFEHHIIYVGRRAPARLSEFTALSKSVSTIPYSLWRWYRFTRQISRALQERQIDAVLCHNFGQHPFVGLGASWAGIQRVYTIVASSPCMTSGARLRNRLKGWLGRRWCKLEVAVSSPVAQELVTDLGLPADRVRTIVNCCLTEEISERADLSRRRRTVTEPQLLMVARMDDAKDHDMLLQAISVLKKQGLTPKLCLAGEGPRKGELIQKCHSLDITYQVIFHGARHDIPELLGACDLFVFATKTEGFGLALIEAMSAGIPIISSDLPVCRQILDDGKCGVLVPVGNANLLAEKIRYLLEHLVQAQELAAAARVAAHTRFSPKATVDQYAQLLRGELDSTAQSPE